MSENVPSLSDQPLGLPILYGFTLSPLEDSHHLQLSTCRVTVGAACQRDAPDTSIPRDPSTSGVSNLHLPLGPMMQRFPVVQD
jgi:hypothetical protein